MMDDDDDSVEWIWCLLSWSVNGLGNHLLRKMLNRQRLRRRALNSVDMSFVDKTQSNGIMLSRIIFATAVSLTILAVLLLSVLSPVPYKNNDNGQDKPLITFSLFIQQPTSPTPTPTPDIQRVQHSSSGVFTFHRILTQGPQTTSKIVGKAQGFIIPVHHIAYSAFNIIYFTFDTPDYSGSLSLRAKQLELEQKKRDELVVLGGTGSFAFARGVAVFEHFPGSVAPIYQVNLQLTFPNQVQSIRV